MKHGALFIFVLSGTNLVQYRLNNKIKGKFFLKDTCLLHHRRNKIMLEEQKSQELGGI